MSGEIWVPLGLVFLQRLPCLVWIFFGRYDRSCLILLLCCCCVRARDVCCMLKQYSTDGGAG